MRLDHFVKWVRVKSCSIFIETTTIAETKKLDYFKVMEGAIYLHYQ